MKKYKVTYQNYCILFGDDRVSKVVEAESAEKAISKVHCDNMGKYATGNYSVTEITGEEI